MTQGRAKGLRVGLAIMVGGMLGACGSAPDTLRTVATLPLPAPDVTAVEVDSAGIFWLAAPGAILRLTPDSLTPQRLAVAASEPPEFVGRTDSIAVFRTSSSLIAASLSGETILAERAGTHSDVAVLDVRDRYLFTTSLSGEVIIYRPETLDPIWGWAAVGSLSEAVALSPQGDRVYQAVGPSEYRESPEILVRDLQTGRILRTVEMPEIVRALVAAPSGSLYGTMWNDELGAASAFALVWEAGELDVAWRRGFGDIGIQAPATLKLSPDGDSIGILGLNEEAGIHILDVNTGDTMDRLRIEALDFAFDPAGRLYLLVPGELRRLE